MSPAIQVAVFAVGALILSYGIAAFFSQIAKQCGCDEDTAKEQ